MNSRTTKAFWRLMAQLPTTVRHQARQSYRQFREDPYHSSLGFKRVSQTEPVYSARISRDYRAVAIKQGDTLIWFWIGSHADYDKLLKRL